MSIANPTLVTLAAVALSLLMNAPGVLGQQNKEQQKCLNKLNKDGAAVAKAQGKEHLSCLKKAGKGKLLSNMLACITADEKMKVQKKKDKTLADDGDFCGQVPGFAYLGAGTVNAAAVQGETDLLSDVFGTDLDGAVIGCDTDKDGCICQQKVMKNIEKIAATKLKEFLKCKKQALKGGANSAAALIACVNDGGTVGSIAADSKGKIQKKVDKLGADIGDKCDAPGVTGAFPGDCTGQSGSALRDCLDAQVECRVCQIINDMDGLFINCDLFDDGNPNESCASGVGPTPTVTDTPLPPTSTPTVTPTFTPGGPTFQGALLKTTGLFTYAGMIGIPGSDTECNDKFPGTHTCNFPELLVAEAAGELVGATDVDSNAVTSFWAIDATHSNLIQCGVTVPWDYQTAHTGHQGEFATLNNATGDLLAPTTGLVCLFQHWVGCCF